MATGGVRSVPCRTASTASSGSTAGRYVTGLEDSLKLAVMFYFWISFPIVHYYYGIYIHFFLLSLKQIQEMKLDIVL